MAEHTFSVKELNEYIKNVIDAEAFFENVLIMGEISSYNVARNIAYFNIKDDESILNCVLFGADKAGQVKIGDMVLLRGSVKYYTKGGRLSFNAISLQQYGKGVLYQRFLQLKEKLDSLGYFDPKIKKVIPTNIKRVGVITSKTGAVLQDIRNIIARRNPMLDIVLFNVQVQGNSSKSEIIEAINFFSDYEKIDVIIVARGGGSIEDMQPFNEEEVAVAAYNCKKPIISAVGHETDFTIIDFVADLRAPTPTAAAELVSKDITEQKNNLFGMQQFFINNISNKLNNFLNLSRNSVLSLKNTLDIVISEHQHSLIFYKHNFNKFMEDIIQEESYRLGLSLNSLEKLNPLTIMKKGFAHISKNNIPINTVRQLKIDDEIKLTLLDGIAITKIRDIKEN